MTTPADELRAAAKRLRSGMLITHIILDVPLADLLEAVSNDPDDASLDDPGSERHNACDRSVCAPAAALHVARLINGS